MKDIEIRNYGGIDNFNELSNDIYDHLHNNKKIDVEKYNYLGNYHGFFEEETYYKVKDNE